MGLKLSREDLKDLARGAAFLGTGGGGNPYVGRLMVERALDETGREIELLDLSEVPDDALVIPTAMMGAPTCIVEKLPNGAELVSSFQRLEAHLGKKGFATMPIEAGGMNSMMPLVVGLRLGIPVVDGDGMGRAFPELFHETFHIYGVSGSPLVLTNDHLDTCVIEAHDNFALEWFARGLTIRMGGVGYIAEFPMDGATAKRVSVSGTIGLGLRVGKAIRDARGAHRDPFAAISDVFATTEYTPAKVIFDGKVTEVSRKTEQGWAMGHVLISPQSDFDTSDELFIRFQNENIIARLGEQVLAVVPDLICVLDSETAEPITTEELRYGQRVKVMAVQVPDIMRTPEALAVWGPRHFGIDMDYQPMAVS